MTNETKPIEGITTDKKLKWFTPEAWDGLRVYAQHAFIQYETERPYTCEPYIGNKQLCNNRFLDDGNEEIMPFDEIEEEVQHNACCKHCLRISKKFNINDIQK